jgi:hypothetical protein
MGRCGVFEWELTRFVVGAGNWDPHHCIAALVNIETDLGIGAVASERSHTLQLLRGPLRETEGDPYCQAYRYARKRPQEPSFIFSLIAVDGQQLSSSANLLCTFAHS